LGAGGSGGTTRDDAIFYKSERGGSNKHLLPKREALEIILTELLIFPLEIEDMRTRALSSIGHTFCQAENNKRLSEPWTEEGSG